MSISCSACSLLAPHEDEVFASSGSSMGGAAGALTTGGTGAASSGGETSTGLGGATVTSGGFTSAGAGPSSGGTSGATSYGVDLERGLVAYYAFDERSGDTVADAKDPAHNGVCVGTCVHPSGLSGGAVGLRNADRNLNWIELPSGLLSALTATSISLWVRDLSASRKDAPAFHFSRGANEVVYFVPDDVVPDTSASGCSFGVKHMGTQIVGIRSDQSLTDNNWHHVAITWTGTAVSVYIDSVRIGSRANPSALPVDLGVTSPNYLGRALADDIPAINADLDELRIYDRALAVDEVDALYGLR